MVIDTRQNDPRAGVHPAELAAAAIVVAAGCLLLGSLVGYAAGCWLSGAGWTWPATRNQAFAIIGALLDGQPTDAISFDEDPSAAVIYAVVSLTLVLTVVVLVVMGRWVLAFVRPRGTDAGFATRAEATAVLGPVRKGRAAEIRPDLYLRRPTTTEPNRLAEQPPGHVVQTASR